VQLKPRRLQLEGELYGYKVHGLQHPGVLRIGRAVHGHQLWHIDTCASQRCSAVVHIAVDAGLKVGDAARLDLRFGAFVVATLQVVAALVAEVVVDHVREACQFQGSQHAWAEALLARHWTICAEGARAAVVTILTELADNRICVAASVGVWPAVVANTGGGLTGGTCVPAESGSIRR